MAKEHICINCQRDLVLQNGVWLCLHCNSDEVSELQVLTDDRAPDDYVFIECPGATLYQPGTNNVIAGVKFFDNEDPFKGYKIIGEPVFAPTHRKKRLIKRDALGKIRRCQGCQDYTVRMRRKEGADFFIPSPKHPNRKKLKSVTHTTYEP